MIPTKPKQDNQTAALAHLLLVAATLLICMMITACAGQPQAVFAFGVGILGGAAMLRYWIEYEMEPDRYAKFLRDLHIETERANGDSKKK